MNEEKKRIGLIVNPYAGIGGRVALKGSDGEDIVQKALALGAVQMSPVRAKDALRELLPYKDEFELVTYPGDMGENEAKELGFDPIVIGELSGEITTAEDTKHAAKDMLNRAVEIIIFAGGDGTARDMYDVIGVDAPVIGIPAGCKIHSGVYGADPVSSGKLAALFVSGKTTTMAELEVMDIDEDAFRTGVVEARLYGYLKTLDEPTYTQGAKASSHAISDEVYFQAIAERVVMEMKPEKLYFVGSGTTTRAIMERLELPNTLLGIDVVKNKELILKDATEKQLLEIMDTVENEGVEIIVTPVGGQGYIFGRGNQQLSPAVIRKAGGKNAIKVVAAPTKIDSLPNQKIRVDTGDTELNDELRSMYRVTTGFAETHIVGTL